MARAIRDTFPKSENSGKLVMWPDQVVAQKVLVSERRLGKGFVSEEQGGGLNWRRTNLSDSGGEH